MITLSDGSHTHVQSGTLGYETTLVTYLGQPRWMPPGVQYGHPHQVPEGNHAAHGTHRST